MTAINRKFIFGLVVLEILTISGLLLLFSRLESEQTKGVTTVIGTLIRDESSLSRSYLLAQSLEDMQSFGAIKCAKVTRITKQDSSVFYDSTFREGCPKENLEKIVLKGLDGNDWNFRLAPNIHISFYILKWFTLIFSGLFLLFAYRFILGEFTGEQEKRREIEIRKTFLENLAEQVKHDAASPISALQVIADRAPLDPETRVFLREAVKRTNGIFLSLNQFKLSDETVEIGPEVESIVREKKLAFRDFPEVKVCLGNTAVICPRDELSRLISNVLENARQARAENISLWTEEDSSKTQILISDDGQKFPQSVVMNLGKRGNTSGKPGGSGLGLYHASSLMSSLGGSLEASNDHKWKLKLTFPIKV